MKLVGKAIRTIVRASELNNYIGTRFYNALAPQGAAYPLAVGKVVSVSPVDSKASPGLRLGMACTDVYQYRITIFDHDAENAAVIATKFRKVLDRPRPKDYGDGMQINMSIFRNAQEDAFVADDGDLFSWTLDFEIRMDFSTDNI